MLKHLREHALSRPVIEVGWVDAAHSPEDSAMELSEFGGLTFLVSVGYLVRAEKDFIVLATDFCPEDGSVRSSLTIPLGWIVFVKSPTFLLKGRKFSTYIEEFSDATTEGHVKESHRRKHRRANQVRPPQEAGGSDCSGHSPQVGSPNPQEEVQVT